MRTRKLQPLPPAPELTGRQFAGRMIVFFVVCLLLFRGLIWLGDTFVTAG